MNAQKGWEQLLWHTLKTFKSDSPTLPTFVSHLQGVKQPQLIRTKITFCITVGNVVSATKSTCQPKFVQSQAHTS